MYFRSGAAWLNTVIDYFNNIITHTVFEYMESILNGTTFDATSQIHANANNDKLEYHYYFVLVTISEPHVSCMPVMGKLPMMLNSPVWYTYIFDSLLASVYTYYYKILLLYILTTIKIW